MYDGDEDATTPSEVHEAQVLVADQARCSMSFALALLEATAGARNLTLDDLASEVIDGRYTFAPRLSAPPRRRLLRAADRG